MACTTRAPHPMTTAAAAAAAASTGRAAAERRGSGRGHKETQGRGLRLVGYCGEGTLAAVVVEQAGEVVVDTQSNVTVSSLGVR